MTTTWWCSFVEPSRPEGQRFLGVVLIPMPVGADVPLVAMALWALGVNPGGEMLAYPWSEVAVPEKFTGRLLTKAEATYADEWMANAYPDLVESTPDELRELGTVAGGGES